MTKRRVLVVNHFAASLGQAGGTRHIELFSRLREWEFLIVAANRNHQTGELVKSIPGIRSVWVAPYSSNGARRILNWVSFAVGAILVGVRQRQVQIVYGSSPHMLAAAAALVIARLKRIPFVLEIRDLWPRVLVEMGALRQGSWLHVALTKLEEYLYAQASCIVVLAQGSRDELITRGVPAEKIVYIPNGADSADFEVSTARESIRQRLGFTRFTAVYAGAHGPANGLDLVLDAVDTLRDLDLDIVLVGGGVSKAGLVEEAARRSLTNVRFLDPVPKSQIPELLAAADVGLHVLADVEMFRSAVSPNKIFDYFAAGLPVVTNCPGLVSQLVQDAGAGYSTEPGDMASGLRQAASATQEARDQMGNSGRDWLQANQSRGAMASRLEAALQQAVNR